MKNTNNNPNVKIIYKNNEAARNKLIDFIINLILDSNIPIGDYTSDCKNTIKRGDNRKNDY